MRATLAAMKAWTLLFCVGCQAVPEPPPDAPPADPAPPEVAWQEPEEKTSAPLRVFIDGASIEQSGDGARFAIEARVDNGGADVAMQTNFASVFDGFTLVVARQDGSVLARQAYVAHQSPYAEDRALTIARGTSRQRLVFPLVEWPHEPGGLVVSLEGGFRGTKWGKGLHSNAYAVPAR
jgi:hypothetical protein